VELTNRTLPKRISGGAASSARLTAMRMTIEIGSCLSVAALPVLTMSLAAFSGWTGSLAQSSHTDDHALG
jgi:hypothetical protein